MFAWPQHFWLFLFNPCSIRVGFLDSCFVATRNLYFYYYSYYYDTKCMCVFWLLYFYNFFLIFPQILALSINWINRGPLTNESIPPNSKYLKLKMIKYWGGKLKGRNNICRHLNFDSSNFMSRLVLTFSVILLSK